MFYTNICKKGNKIYHIGYKNGSRFINEAKFKPSIFYEVFGDEAVSKSLLGHDLKEKKFDSISEYYRFMGQNKDILEMFSDVDPTWQYLTKKYHDKIDYCQSDICMWYLDIEVKSESGFPFPYLAEAPVVSITIYDTKREIFVVLGLKDFDADEAIINLQKRFPTLDIKKILKKIKYKKCDDEKDLLRRFIDLSKTFQPDIYIAHHGEGFDYPYLINRINNIKLNSNDLSPVGSAKSKYNAEEDNFLSNKATYYNNINGISLLDNELLYKKYILKPRDSWSLSNLAIEDLGLDKIDYDEYDNLNALYDQNHQLFIEYNIFDVVLMILLNQKNGYVNIHVRNTYVAKVPNFEDAMSPVKSWDSYIYHQLQKHNIQVIGKKYIEKFTYAGGYVLDVITELTKWVITADLNSLYPHIQMGWNISPETLVTDLDVISWLSSLSDDQIDEYIDKAETDAQKKFLKDLKQLNMLGYTLDGINQKEIDERILNKLIPTHPDYIMSGNGYYYRREMGCIPKLLFTNYAERKAIKKQNLILKSKVNQTKDESISREIENNTTAEQGIKVFMNAEYGALANNFFRWCRYELCSAVTLNGQLVLKTLLKEIEKTFPDIIICAGDTDSLIFSLENLVNKNCEGFDDDQIIDYIENFCDEQLQPLINKTYDDLAKYVGAPKNYMIMEVEKIISDALWTAKKRYAIRTIVEDGIRLKEPKYDFKGLDCIKSSTPKAIRELQKETIKVVLRDVSSVQNIMNECKEKIFQLDPTQIASPKTCNGIKKYSDEEGNPIKGAQAHVKGVLAYNKYIRAHKLENEYPIIQDGEKVKFVWLKVPNPIGSETFAFINRIPNDPNILDYLDYNTMYEKAYDKQMNDLLERIGMQSHNNKEVDLTDLF